MRFSWTAVEIEVWMNYFDELHRMKTVDVVTYLCPFLDKAMLVEIPACYPVN